MTQITQHFTEEELSCPHCSLASMNPRFMELLQAARYIYNRPMKISSGYRCPEHNKIIGGEPDSSHVLGLAVDIKIYSSREAYEIEDALRRVGFTRLGRYKKHIHVDYDQDKSQKVSWYGEY